MIAKRFAHIYSCFLYTHHWAVLNAARRLYSREPKWYVGDKQITFVLKNLIPVDEYLSKMHPFLGKGQLKISRVANKAGSYLSNKLVH